MEPGLISTVWGTIVKVGRPLKPVHRDLAKQAKREKERLKKQEAKWRRDQRTAMAF